MLAKELIALCSAFSAGLGKHGGLQPETAPSMCRIQTQKMEVVGFRGAVAAVPRFEDLARRVGLPL